MGLFHKIFADPKTSITVIVSSLAQVIGVFGFNITPDIQMAIVSVTVLVLGLVARDTKVLPPQREE
jgi:hypothetical protein